jgi:hypothetical protein
MATLKFTTKDIYPIFSTPSSCTGNLHLRNSVNDQLDAQFYYTFIVILILYMFRAPLLSSSGESELY